MLAATLRRVCRGASLRPARAGTAVAVASNAMRSAVPRAMAAAGAAVNRTPARALSSYAEAAAARPAPKKPLLTQQQIRFLDDNGYLVLNDFCPKEELKKLQSAALKILDDFDPNAHRSVFSTGEDQNRTADEYFLTSGDKVRCFFEDKAFHPNGTLKQDKRLSINKIGHAMHELDPAFVAFQQNIPLRQLCYELGYRKPQLVQSMYIFKQPRIGGKVDAHQDSTFLYTDPASVTGFWFAVEDATLKNGCLWALPGSHKSGTHSRFIRNPNARAGSNAPKTVFEPYPQPTAALRALEQQHDGKAHTTTDTYTPAALQRALDRWAVPLEVKAGAAVLLHGALVHLSYDNLSDASRHAYTLHVIEQHNTAYPKQNWLQRADGTTNFLPFGYAPN